MSIKFEKENGIARIVLARPNVFNSVNAELAGEFVQALKDCEQDEEIRVVCVSGEGKAFCAGQDLKEATSPDLMPGFRNLLDKHYRPIISAIIKLSKPVVMAVNGVAAGAGANIALAGDVIVAKESASFIQAFSGIGLVPDSGGTFHLPRKVGRAKAMAYALLGDKINAVEAERVGMIYKYFPDDSFEDEVEKILNKMVTMPTRALGMTKELINNTWSYNLTTQFDLETEAQLDASRTEDYQEGVQAFLEKRKPIFKGK